MKFGGGRWGELIPVNSFEKIESAFLGELGDGTITGGPRSIHATGGQRRIGDPGAFSIFSRGQVHAYLGTG